MDFLTVTYWHWFIAAALLLCIQVFVGDAIFLWLGATAVGVGIVAYFLPELGFAVHLILFVGFSALSIFLWKKYGKKLDLSTDHPNLNRPAEELVGREFVLIQAIENNRGRIKVGDTEWLVTGPDRAKGERVKVISAEGTILRVE